jgi:hypothetical protein
LFFYGDIEMKMKIVYGVLGLASLVAASLANAATVSLTPASNNVSLGDTFTLTVGGTEFAGLATGGSVNLNWDANFLSVDPTTISLATGFAADGISPGTLFWNTIGTPTFGPGALDITATLEDSNIFGSPFPAVGPSFDFLSLSFTVIGAPVVPSDVLISQGSGGFWQDDAGNDIIGVTYGSATVTVNAVPVPAAVWLFGSGLLGLVGVARRRQVA